MPQPENPSDLTTQILRDYEDVPYLSDPIEPSHPDVLATAATLAGLQPVAPDRSRVLEVGCASGGNLLPLAASFPASEFVGIDISPAQISEARRIAQGAEIHNVSLQATDLAEFNAEPGSFDYIICHGVYSWMPPRTADKLLSLLGRCLASQGVAYVSYNTYPGWR